VRSPLLVIGGIVMAYLLSPTLSILFIVILPLIIGSIILVLNRSVPLYTQVQKRLDRVNTVMRENLLGVRVVKSFNLEASQFARFSQVNDGLTGDNIRAQNLTFLLMPVVTLVMNFSVVFILWYGGGMVVAQGFELGKIIAFVNYLIQITRPPRRASTKSLPCSRPSAPRSSLKSRAITISNSKMSAFATVTAASQSLKTFHLRSARARAWVSSVRPARARARWSA